MKDLVAKSYLVIKDAFNPLREHRTSGKPWPAKRHAQGIY